MTFLNISINIKNIFTFFLFIFFSEEMTNSVLVEEEMKFRRKIFDNLEQEIISNC